jgi:hypothetical protein
MASSKLLLSLENTCWRYLQVQEKVQSMSKLVESRAKEEQAATQKVFCALADKAKTHLEDLSEAIKGSQNLKSQV